MTIQETDYLEHYGRRGMKWYQHIYGEEDSRAAYNKSSNTDKKTKKKTSDPEADRKAKRTRNILIGTAIVGSLIAAYGGYRFVKGVRDKDMELAIKHGENMAKDLLESDLRMAERQPEAFGYLKSKKLSDYSHVVDEYKEAAKSHTFKEAFANAKKASETAKRELKEAKRAAKDDKDLIRKLTKPKDQFELFGASMSLDRIRDYNPTRLARLGIEFIDGSYFLNGKKIL